MKKSRAAAYSLQNDSEELDEMPGGAAGPPMMDTIVARVI